MKKKGFTLIELLAVIIILAVIALIATPAVLNVVENAREEARKDSIIGYADAVKLSYTEELLNKTGKPLKELANSKMQGDEVACEIVKYDSKKYGSLLYNCKVKDKGNYCYYSGKVYDNESEECENVYQIITTGELGYKDPTISVLSQNPVGTEYGQSKTIKIEFPDSVLVKNYYVRTSNNTALSNAISTCGTDVEPGECSEMAPTSEDAIWYEVSGNVEIEISKNIVIEAAIKTTDGYTVVRYEENLIDVTGPEVDLSLSSKTDRIVVSSLCNDTESGISKYEYKINDDEFIEGIDSGYVFEELDSETEYEITVRCTNGSGLTDEASSNITTTNITNPTIAQYNQTPEDLEYAIERVIRITYNGENIENPVYQYSLDGNDWKTVTTETYDVIFTNNGYLYARTLDPKGNIANASTYTVDNIDTNVPDVVLQQNGSELVLTVTPEDTLSGYNYKWYKNENIIDVTENTYIISDAGTYKVIVTTGSGISVNSNEIKVSGPVISYNLNGGTGSISNTITPEGESVNITNEVPTRSGYDFMGWGTSSTDTTVDYESNATYTSSENTTLYAIWRKTVTITYSGNGATSGSTASQECYMYNADENCSIKINSNGFAKTGYIFTGWGTGTSSVTHNAGSTYKFTNSTTLNAIWVAPYLSLGSTSGSVYTGDSKTVSIKGIGYGTLSCKSSSTSKATCSISGTTLTITAKTSTGSVTITVTGSNGYTATYTLTINKPNSSYFSCSSGTMKFDEDYGYICVSSTNREEVYDVDTEEMYCSDTDDTYYAEYDGDSETICSEGVVTNGCSYREYECWDYTYKVVDYTCPSGWKKYSGSGSSLVCYKTATVSSSSISSICGSYSNKLVYDTSSKGMYGGYICINEPDGLSCTGTHYYDHDYSYCTDTYYDSYLEYSGNGLWITEECEWYSSDDEYCCVDTYYTCSSTDLTCDSGWSKYNSYSCYKYVFER